LQQSRVTKSQISKLANISHIKNHIIDTTFGVNPISHNFSLPDGPSLTGVVSLAEVRPFEASAGAGDEVD